MEQNGYIGIAPYTNEDKYKYFNFMWQLKNISKKITHNIVSLYTRLDQGKSVIKFGSWDQTAIDSSTTLNMLKTKDKNSWALSANAVAVFSH